MRELRRDLPFPSIRPARPAEFKAAVIGNVHLLVGPVDPEHIAAQGDPLQMVCRAKLVKVRGRNLRRVRPLHHPTRVLAGNTATIAGVKADRQPVGGSVGNIGLRLKTRSSFQSAILRDEAVLHVKTEIIETQAGRKSPSKLRLGGRF